MKAAVCVTLCLCFWSSVLCEGTQNVTVRAGENVTLECWFQVSENDVIELVEWNKPDLKSEKYVFCFRENNVNGDYQHPLFHDRVELRDPEMKNGDVSVLLKNVTVNDAGMYECRVRAGHRGRRRVKRHKPELVSIIELTVREPLESLDSDHTHGHTGGGDEDAGNEGRGDKPVPPGWIALACVFGVIVVPGLIFLGFRLRKKNSHQPVAADEGL